MMTTESSNQATSSVHSEEIQDVIGTPPRWLFRWGISMVLVVLMVCIIISAYISYPESISTLVKILPANPPCIVTVKDSGTLVKLLVKNKNIVKTGDSLAIIENEAGRSVIKALKNGELSFAGVLHEGQELSSKQHIFYISGSKTDFYGEMLVPQNEVYRVKPGQTVSIYLRNADEEKNNTFTGTIKYITGDLLKNEQYVAEVEFVKLEHNETTYKMLYSGMIADAGIITSNTTLFHRLIHSLTSSIK